jgi:hypothetical protein
MVAAAVMAGLGVAALAPRMLPFGALTWVKLGFGFAELASSFTEVKDGRSRDALAARLPGARCDTANAPSEVFTASSAAEGYAAETLSGHYISINPVRRVIRL